MQIPEIIYRLAYKLLRVIARLGGVDQFVISKSDELLNHQSALAAGGLLYWFLALKRKWRVPNYNIHTLICGDKKKHSFCLLMQPRISEYKVAKQYFLLSGDDYNDSAFIDFVTRTLQTCISRNAKKTGLKKHKYSTGKALAALLDINDLFNKHDAKLFLVSGTLLGFVRDGGPIPGDYDIDVGIFDTDENGLAIVDGFSTIAWCKNVHRNGDFIQIKHSNGIIIDLFIHSEREGKVWHGTDVHQWYNSPFKLVKKGFGSLETFVPDDCVKYLDENYGDWRQEALFWDYSFDTPNRVFCRNRKTALFLLERAIDGIGKRPTDRYCVQTALHALATQFSYPLDFNLGPGTYLEKKNMLEETKRGEGN